MDLRQICEKAEKDHQITQRELAQRIGLQPTALSHVMNRRRKLPAEAAIELSELTGLRAKEVWTAAVRWAKSHGTTTALMLLTVVSLFVSAPGNALAAQAVQGVSEPVIPIMAVWRRVARRVRTTAKRLAAWLQGTPSSALRPAG